MGVVLLENFKIDRSNFNAEEYKFYNFKPVFTLFQSLTNISEMGLTFENDYADCWTLILPPSYRLQAMANMDQ